MRVFDFFTHFIIDKLKTNSQNGISKICYKIGIASTSIGIAFTICAALIMNGFHSNIENRISSLIGDINIANNNSIIETDPVDTTELKYLTNKLTEKIAEVKSYAYKMVLIQHGNDFEGITLYGLDNTAHHNNIKQYISKGLMPNMSLSYHENEIIISNICAQKLNLSVGDILTICILKTPPSYRNVKVCGIYDSKFPDFDAKFAFCDIRFIQKINNWNTTCATGINIFLKRKEGISNLTKDINKKLHYTTAQAMLVQDLYHDIFEWISILYKNTFIFIILLLVIVNTNLAAIISTQIINSIYMIGVLKSLGANVKQLIKIFTKYNLEIIIKGVLYGNIFGLGLCFLQSYTGFIKLNPEIHYVNNLPVSWNWPLVGLINFTVFITSLMVLISTQIVILRSKRLVEKKI